MKKKIIHLIIINNYQKNYPEISLQHYTAKGTTKASSDSSAIKHKIKPEIYSIEKFGVLVKTKQIINEPLKFIFHFYNFKCKMLTENEYILCK